MSDKELLIEKVSKLYREQEKKVTDLKSEMRKLEEKLKDKRMPHHEYVGLERRLKMLDSEYSTQVYTAYGVSLAREALFD